MDRRFVDEIVIRPATPEDTDAIGQLWLQLVEYHNHLSPDLPHAAYNGAKQYARRIASRLLDTHTRVLVAEHKGRIIGYVFGVITDMMPEMFEEEVAGFLADIFVESDYRGRGVGRALVNGLTDWFREHSVQYFEWYVATSNRDGFTFWQAMGGREIVSRMRIDLNNSDNSENNS
jgi:GNAT superfamily N-acetyltransferase